MQKLTNVIMKIISLLSTALLASAEAFSPPTNNNQLSSTSLRAEIGETGVQFEHVAREWRCKVSLPSQKDPSSSVCIYNVLQ